MFSIHLKGTQECPAEEIEEDGETDSESDDGETVEDEDNDEEEVFEPPTPRQEETEGEVENEEPQ